MPSYVFGFLYLVAGKGSKSGSKDPDHRGFPGILGSDWPVKKTQNQWKMTPKPLYYIYTLGDCTGLFLYIKKNAKIYKDCRGFWVKKNALLEAKINFLTIFRWNWPQNLWWQWFGPSNPWFESILIKNDQKPRKKSGKNHFLTPFFNFPGSPPWKMQKIDFPIWNLHLKWLKLPEVLVIFWFFSFFDPKTMVLTIFDPKNQKTPKKSWKIH